MLKTLKEIIKKKSADKKGSKKELTKYTREKCKEATANIGD